MQTRDFKRPRKLLWAKECDRLVSAASFISVARRILICGLIATLIAIVVGHFTRLPQSHLRWAALFIITAGAAVEILWKCLSAYLVGAARAKWMKQRSVLVGACSQIATCADDLHAFTVGKTEPWIKPFSEIASSIPVKVQDILASVNDIDQSFREMGDVIGSGPFLAVGCSKALARLPKIWERVSLILPRKMRCEAFDPAFNDMLEAYLRAQKFLGKRGQRWLAFAFTMCALLMVLDCIRVLLTSGAGRLLLGVLPQSFRNWWRRQ